MKKQISPILIAPRKFLWVHDVTEWGNSELFINDTVT